MTSRRVGAQLGDQIMVDTWRCLGERRLEKEVVRKMEVIWH